MKRSLQALGGCLLAGLAAACSPQSTETAVPAERQVFQRDAGGGAQVEIRGTTRSPARRMEFSVLLAHEEQTPWTPLTLEPAGGLQTFHVSLRLPQGGWYSLLVRRDGGPPITAVQRFGVGDLFLLAGQSNATNTGESRQPGVNDRVAMFDGERWWHAADPMVGVQDRSRSGSPWPVFGDLIQRSAGVPIGLAAVGHGNTLMADWHPRRPPVSRHLDSSRYPELRRRLQAMGGARAILWHQGESDAHEGTSSDAYVDDFRDLQQALAADTGLDIPWVVAGASVHTGVAEASIAAVRRAQETLWRDGLALRGADTDDMHGDLRTWDGLHFSTRGLRVHGERWYAAVWTALYAPAQQP